LKTRRSPPRTPQRVHTRARFLGRKHHHFILNENSSGPAGRIKCALHVAPRTKARGLCPALPGSRKHLGAPITSTLTGQASPSRPISKHIGYARAPNSQGPDSPDSQPRTRTAHAGSGPPAANSPARSEPAVSRVRVLERAQ